MGFKSHIKNDQYYTVNEIDHVIDLIKDDLITVKSSKKVEIFNIPCSFDIETTSFYEGAKIPENKRAMMYIWMFGIDGVCIVGRTWEEYYQLLDDLQEMLDLGIKYLDDDDHLGKKIKYERRLIVYVHNLEFEFQFFRCRDTWHKVFAIDTRRPCYAINERGIEYRCSCILTGKTLANLSKDIPEEYGIKKMVGDLDYTLPRHAKTPLTDTEMMYCINDIRVVMCYIYEQIQIEGNIINIPLTKTGYVRRHVRSRCIGTHHHKNWQYIKLIKALTLEPGEYSLLKRAFIGGYTHANALYSDREVYFVSSDDLTSSYPTVMCSERYPMSKGEHIELHTMEEFERNLKLYCCVFDVLFYNLRPKFEYDNYISSSKCFKLENPRFNNGRVISADICGTTCTDVDFELIGKYYYYDEIRIKNFVRYRKGYLPKDFIQEILKFYCDKTTLKGVPGRELDYMLSKQNANSCYGMIVTDIVRDEITYTNDWGLKKCDIDKEIAEYNTKFNRFLYYPWGVWVTAYARRNLCSAMLEFNQDYVYCDTDSIKGLNRHRHVKYFKQYNKDIVDKLRKMLKFYKLPEELIHPKTIKGEVKTLGLWDYEGTSDVFKSLGAKRYMSCTDGQVSLTVSGLNKKMAVPYLIGDMDMSDPESPAKVMAKFTNEMYIPPEHTGKLMHTYIDDETEGYITDYLGTQAEYFEYSGVHLEPTEYSLSIAVEYANYIKDIREDEL